MSELNHPIPGVKFRYDPLEIFHLGRIETQNQYKSVEVQLDGQNFC